jgi:CBS domain-containing protein
MTQVSEVMTPAPLAVGPQTTLREAAEEMDRLDVGALPVCDGGRLVGLLTDRDVTVRATSAGLPPEEASVEMAMTTDPYSCREEDDVSEAERIMAERQIRRLPVVDAAENLVGMVSLGDFAAEGERGVKATLDAISRPVGPDREEEGEG